MNKSRLLIPFSEIGLQSLPEVGGKNASLGELLGSLTSAGVYVPDGFAITAETDREAGGVTLSWHQAGDLRRRTRLHRKLASER